MKVAFIGMGTMGAAMAINILNAGHTVTVHNRTREREEPVAKAGARRSASPQEAARNAELIVICVSDTPDVEAVILGANGVIHGAPAGAIVVDMSTISPSATRRMAGELGKKEFACWMPRCPGDPKGRRKAPFPSWWVERPPMSKMLCRCSKRWVKPSPTSGRSAPAR